MRDEVACVMFDLDDTLWECKPVIQRAERLFYEWCERSHPKITQRFTPSELVQNRISFCREKPEWHYHLTKLRKAWLESLVSECGTDDSLIDEGFEVYWLARNEVALLEGVESFLLDLKEQYVVGAITNGNADVEHIGLGYLFDFSVSSIQAGVAKPDHRIFQFAAEKAETPLEQILHVGDDWKRDVQGALRAGAKAAWVTGLSSGKPDGQDQAAQPHFEVSSVLELREALL